MKFKFWICGTSGEDSEKNPLTLVKKEECGSILEILLKGPISYDKIKNQLSKEEIETLENMLDLQVLRKENQKIYLNFSMFVLKDYELMEEVTNKAAQLICDKFKKDWNALSELVSNTGLSSSLTIEEKMFCILGCIILDWAGLHWLDDGGILYRGKMQPNDQEFVLFGTPEEVYERNFTRFCFSSTEGFEWYFTVFGQTLNRRWVPPFSEKILLYLARMSERADMIPHLDLLNKNLQLALQYYLNTMVKVLIEKKIDKKQLDKYGFRENKMNLIEEYLQKMGFIKINEKNEWKRNILILGVNDIQNLEAINKICKPILVDSMNELSEIFEEKYKKTLAGLHKVPLKEAMNDWWHEIFSLVNMLLIKEKLISPRYINDKTKYDHFIFEEAMNLFDLLMV